MNIFRKIFEDKKNYYNIITAIFIGIMLLFLTSSFTTSAQQKEKTQDFAKQEIKTDSSYEANLEQRLGGILSQVSGVGEVDVMITLENGRELVTKEDNIGENSITNEKALNGDERKIQSSKEQSTTVKINGDEPLVVKELSPKINGVLIVAKGGGNVDIKNTLIKATNALLGVEVHKIEVLEMK